MLLFMIEHDLYDRLSISFILPSLYPTPYPPHPLLTSAEAGCIVIAKGIFLLLSFALDFSWSIDPLYFASRQRPHSFSLNSVMSHLYPVSALSLSLYQVIFANLLFFPTSTMHMYTTSSSPTLAFSMNTFLEPFFRSPSRFFFLHFSFLRRSVSRWFHLGLSGPHPCQTCHTPHRNRRLMLCYRVTTAL
jgi:hypothetical protein